MCSRQTNVKIGDLRQHCLRLEATVTKEVFAYYSNYLAKIR